MRGGAKKNEKQYFIKDILVRSVTFNLTSIHTDTCPPQPADSEAAQQKAKRGKASNPADAADGWIPASRIAVVLRAEK